MKCKHFIFAFFLDNRFEHLQMILLPHLQASFADKHCTSVIGTGTALFSGGGPHLVDKNVC